jgi:CRP-like cAMP-binding protein
LAENELKGILSMATHRQFSGSPVIVRQEDPAERLFLLTSGRGRHFILTNDGRKIPMHWITAGQIVGGAAILSAPCTYLASTELLSDGCALVWERPAIRECVSRFPILLENALSISITEHIEELIGNDDLAVGASVPELAVSIALDDWEREGVLTQGPGKIVLRRPELLITGGNRQLQS